MNRFIITLKIKSALSSPLMSDTLFGHLCWGMRFHEGESSLGEFLESEMKKPGIMFSNGFPKGCLPMPILAEHGIDISDPQKIIKYKKLKKIQYIPAKFILGKKNVLSTRSLLEEDFEAVDFTPRDSIHNVIHRLTGTTVENSLYVQSELWPGPRDEWDIYIFSRYDRSWVEKKLDWTFENGYGADASTGKGWIEVKEISELEIDETKGNRYLCLGNFVPSLDDKLEELNFYADTMTKYGKIGNPGLYGNTNPIKKPVIMYKAGASFDYKEPMSYCGRYLRDIHSNKNIIQNALSPLIPFQEEVSHEKL